MPDCVPAEFRTTHIGKLRKALYGTRPAAASWGDGLRKGLVSCGLTAGTVSRCCFHNELCSVAGTVHGDDIFVAGPRQDTANMGATLEKRWETSDQLIGSKLDDQKELRILYRTLRLSRSKPVSSPATGDGVARCQDDESKPLDEEEKRLYQRIIAKLNYLTHDRLDLKCATSCLASAASSPGIGDMRAAKRVGRYLRKAPVDSQGSLFMIPSLKNSCGTRMLTGLRIRLLGGRRVEVS